MTIFTKNFFFYSKLSPRQQLKFLKVFYLYWGFKSNSYFLSRTIRLRPLFLNHFKSRVFLTKSIKKHVNVNIRIFLKKKFLLIIIFFNKNLKNSRWFAISKTFMKA
jgi:hypothetical protein